MPNSTESQDAPIEQPEGPIQKLMTPLLRFLHVEAASGVVLLLTTVIALFLANSAWGPDYLAFWKTKVSFGVGSFQMNHSLQHWINDGLMVIFFFVIGLEVKREIVTGELRDPKQAMLPLMGAIGGMLVPAVLYLGLQMGQEGQRGWGIPMATDIAFVVGCMAILGKRVPHSLRAFILSLAIADDIGAILVIAIGYTSGIDVTMLIIGFALIGVVFGLSRGGVRSFGVYTLLGVFIWLAFHESGVHATIAGVILGLMTPAKTLVNEGFFAQILGRASEIFHGGGWGNVNHRVEKLQKFRALSRETVSPLEYLEGRLHPWVSFLIMPIFALANAGVVFQSGALGASVVWAIVLGLFVGKPLGILLFSWLAVKLKMTRLPDGVNWLMLTGAGCLAGIGFTMALFIAGLALPAQGDLLGNAKIGILVGSVLSAVLGMILLVKCLPKTIDPSPQESE